MQSLNEHYWPQLYQLMVERNFPDVPPTYPEAVPFFRKASLFGVIEDGKLMVGCVFGPAEDRVAYFDAVCDVSRKGVWSSPETVTELFRLAFVKLKLRCVWVQPEKKNALAAALKAGFVPASPLDAHKPVLVMTPSLLPKRLARTVFEGAAGVSQ